MTFLQYFGNIKPGGCLPPSIDISEGPKQPPGLMFLKDCENVTAHKTCLYILGYVAYAPNREEGLMPLRPLSLLV